jgi:hypothetical protein
VGIGLTIEESSDDCRLSIALSIGRLSIGRLSIGGLPIGGLPIGGLPIGGLPIARTNPHSPFGNRQSPFGSR